MTFQIHTNRENHSSKNKLQLLGPSESDPTAENATQWICNYNLNHNNFNISSLKLRMTGIKWKLSDAVIATGRNNMITQLLTELKKSDRFGMFRMQPIRFDSIGIE